MTTIAITNPFTGRTVTRDVTGITEAELDAYAQLMDDETRERLASSQDWPTPGAFLAAWAAEVGPDEAGRVIIGS